MSQIQVWEFRANESYYSESTLRGFLHKLGKKFVFQLEQGESGYRHWQGRVSLWKVKRKPELMSLMKGMGMEVPNYLEPTTTHEHKHEAFYHMKEDTRVQGPFQDTDKSAYIPRQYRNLDLMPYQKTIIDSRMEFDFRTVDCVVDTEGNSGKSTCAAVADLLYKCIDLPPVNDAEKVIQSLCDILIAKQERKPGIVFFDMPRALNKEKLGAMYTAIEQIKKGKVWDMRNHYKDWWYDSPRVWVFTNAIPDFDFLSRDRWRFWEIDRTTKMLAPFRIEHHEA